MSVRLSVCQTRDLWQNDSFSFSSCHFGSILMSRVRLSRLKSSLRCTINLCISVCLSVCLLVSICLCAVWCRYCWVWVMPSWSRRSDLILVYIGERWDLLLRSCVTRPLCKSSLSVSSPSSSLSSQTRTVSTVLNRTAYSQYAGYRRWPPSSAVCWRSCLVKRSQNQFGDRCFATTVW